MAKSSGICLYLFGSAELIGSVRIDLADFLEIRQPLGKLPRVIGVFNPLRSSPLTDPRITWEETIITYNLVECPTTASIVEAVKRQPVDLVVIHQPRGWDLSLLRQALAKLMREGIHVLLSGEATVRALTVLPVDVPIPAHEDCEVSEADGSACRRPALALVKIFRNLLQEFCLEFLDFWLNVFERLGLGLKAIVPSLTTLKTLAAQREWEMPPLLAQTLQLLTGFRIGITEFQLRCHGHHPSEKRLGRLTVVFGTSGALSQKITGSGKSEYLAKLARAHGSVVYTGLGKESRAEVRGAQFVYVDDFGNIPKNSNSVILVDEFHTIRGSWRNWLETMLQQGKNVVVAQPYSDADGLTMERAPELALLADEVLVHEAACSECQSPAYRLTCRKVEEGDTRRTLDQEEIGALRVGNVRLDPTIKWDAVCLLHQPTILAEPALPDSEASEREAYRTLRMRRRLTGLNSTVWGLLKWVLLVVLGLLAWRYWDVLQPLLTQSLELVLKVAKDLVPAVTYGVTGISRFYGNLPILIRRPVEAVVFTYIVLRLIVSFWLEDRIHRRNLVPGFAGWGGPLVPLSGLAYLGLGLVGLLCLWVGGIAFIFIYLPRTLNFALSYAGRRRKKIKR